MVETLAVAQHAVFVEAMGDTNTGATEESEEEDKGGWLGRVTELLDGLEAGEKEQESAESTDCEAEQHLSLGEKRDVALEQELCTRTRPCWAQSRGVAASASREPSPHTRPSSAERTRTRGEPFSSRFGGTWR